MTAERHARRAKIQREAEGYLELGMAQHALTALDRLDEDSYDGRAYYLRGESLRALERYAEAIAPLQRATHALPDDRHVCVALGWCYKRTGRLDLAIDALQQALIVRPQEALLRYNLACYLSLAGKKRGALRNLSKALAIDPDYRSLIESEPDFDPLRDDPDFQAVCDGVQID